MNKSGTKFLIVSLTLILCVSLLSSNAQGVTVLWRQPNANITIGLLYNTLEFEDPVAPGTRVNGYNVLEWRDADYSAGPPRWYEDWSVSNSNGIDGNPNEIWMRQAGQYIWTTTTVPSSVVSIHLVGDDNDGQVNVLVDGVIYARLDMGTRGLPQTALIIVSNLPYTTHTIRVNDLGWGPISRLGDDVATLGAAALGPNWSAKWWPPFWYLNSRIQLVRTSGYVTIPTGFWWGWYWLYNSGYWYQPWQGPLWWLQSYSGYWYYSYWNYWPWYRYYSPWWQYWRWWGGQWFWGFRDTLTYRYWYWQPRVIYWWSWYWDPPGQGGCFELVTQANENNPSGGRVLPFDQAGIPGFEYSGHQFSVNGKEDPSWEFTPLTFVQTSSLRSYYESISGVTPDDVNNFMASDIVQELLKNDPNGYGYVGVQYAVWDQPDAHIVAEVPPGGETLYYDPCNPSNAAVTVPFYLASPPEGNVTYVIGTSNSSRATIDGEDVNGVVYRYFDSYNWNTSQSVTVRAKAGMQSSDDVEVMLYIHDVNDQSKGFTYSIKIAGSSLGYNEADFNHDNEVNLIDFSTLAEQWKVQTGQASHWYDGSGM